MKEIACTTADGDNSRTQLDFRACTFKVEMLNGTYVGSWLGALAMRKRSIKVNLSEERRRLPQNPSRSRQQENTHGFMEKPIFTLYQIIPRNSLNMREL